MSGIVEGMGCAPISTLVCSATASRNAPTNRFAKIGDQHVMTLQIDDEPEPHWQELRRAIRAARVAGFASFQLDDFVVYSVFYGEGGVAEEQVKDERMLAQVKRLVSHAHGIRNSVTVTALPARDGEPFTEFVLPLYLGEVPQVAIRDILRGRLLIVAAYNMARLEAEIRAAGAAVTRRADGDPRDFGVVIRFKTQGGEGEYRSSAPWRDIHVAVHEFRGAVVCRALAPKQLSQHLSLADMPPVRQEIS